MDNEDSSDNGQGLAMGISIGVINTVLFILELLEAKQDWKNYIKGDIFNMLLVEKCE